MSRLTSSFTCQLISIIITTFVIHHSFTLSLQAQNLPFQQILPTLDIFYLPDCLHDIGTGLDGPIMLVVLFLVSHFNFLFVPCGRLSCLPPAFYCTFNAHYRSHFKGGSRPSCKGVSRNWHSGGRPSLTFFVSHTADVVPFILRWSADVCIELCNSLNLDFYKVSPQLYDGSTLIHDICSSSSSSIVSYT